MVGFSLIYTDVLCSFLFLLDESETLSLGGEEARPHIKLNRTEGFVLCDRLCRGGKTSPFAVRRVDMNTLPHMPLSFVS